MTNIFIAHKILFDKEFVPFAKLEITEKMLTGCRLHENIFFYLLSSQTIM